MEIRPSFYDSLHADIQPSYTDSLMHFGIKGQKWGVRRFEDSSGHLTPAGKRRYDDDAPKGFFAKRKYQKQADNDKLNTMTKFGEEYDNTPQGHQKLKPYQKQLDLLDDYNHDWTDADDNKLFKLEKDYLNAQGRYVAKKMQQKYNKDELTDFMKRNNWLHEGHSIEDSFAKEYEHRHSAV